MQIRATKITNRARWSPYYGSRAESLLDSLCNLSSCRVKNVKNKPSVQKKKNIICSFVLPEMFWRKHDCLTVSLLLRKCATLPTRTHHQIICVWEPHSRPFSSGLFVQHVRKNCIWPLTCVGMEAERCNSEMYQIKLKCPETTWNKQLQNLSKRHLNTRQRTTYAQDL